MLTGDTWDSPASCSHGSSGTQGHDDTWGWEMAWLRGTAPGEDTLPKSTLPPVQNTGQERQVNESIGHDEGDFIVLVKIILAL